MQGCLRKLIPLLRSSSSPQRRQLLCFGGEISLYSHSCDTVYDLVSAKRIIAPAVTPLYSAATVDRSGIVTFPLSHLASRKTFIGRRMPSFLSAASVNDRVSSWKFLSDLSWLSTHHARACPRHTCHPVRFELLFVVTIVSGDGSGYKHFVLYSTSSIFQSAH